MPELPEVETTRQFMVPHVEGRRIVASELRHPRTGRRNENPADIIDRLVGQRVDRLERQGKFILGRLGSGLTWVTHLGMSGRVLIASRGDPEMPHTHFWARTDLGTEIRFIDPRTFGFVAVFTPEELAREIKLGRDALADLPRSPELAGRLSGRRAPIKSLLLDQRIVSGLGNIYADEVLFRARVRPTRPGGELTGDELKKLRAAIAPVLRAGIAAGGTSLNDMAYLLPDGQAGGFRDRLFAYGRENEACRRCGTAIERVVIGGRSSYYCPNCQK
ncbi:MAG TPA: bifunctional DNA-formamidopyrimidine glycosylase/DNA-(apurinic or apyrimidinic site) lyase [Acidimicrobiia bacterium]|nr:bifunctional DNA-formamidopyrimidine glycosylase/DNA-(apurinic or apyrimidinic site) lyase [Acidimicrobiia bacterium]